MCMYLKDGNVININGRGGGIYGYDVAAVVFV